MVNKCKLIIFKSQNKMQYYEKRNVQNEEERLFNKIVVIGEHDMYYIPDELKRLYINIYL